MESAKFSPKARSNKKLVCSVKSCNSTSNKNLDLCFHYFPIKTNRFIYVQNIFGKLEKKSKLEAWMKAVGIKEVNSGMKICSRHFNLDDYILPNVPAKLRRLKNTAVPSLNLLNSTHETAKHDRKVRVVKRNIKKTNPTKKLQQVQPMDSAQSVVYEKNSLENIQDVPDPNTNNQENVSTGCEKYKSSSTEDFGVQVETDFLKSNLINMLKNNSIPFTNMKSRVGSSRRAKRTARSKLMKKLNELRKAALEKKNVSNGETSIPVRQNEEDSSSFSPDDEHVDKQNKEDSSSFSPDEPMDKTFGISSFFNCDTKEEEVNLDFNDQIKVEPTDLRDPLEDDNIPSDVYVKQDLQLDKNDVGLKMQVEKEYSQATVDPPMSSTVLSQSSVRFSDCVTGEAPSTSIPAPIPSLNTAVPSDNLLLLSVPSIATSSSCQSAVQPLQLLLVVKDNVLAGTVVVPPPAVEQVNTISTGSTVPLTFNLRKDTKDIEPFKNPCNLSRTNSNVCILCAKNCSQVHNISDMVDFIKTISNINISKLQKPLRACDLCSADLKTTLKLIERIQKTYQQLVS